MSLSTFLLLLLVMLPRYFWDADLMAKEKARFAVSLSKRGGKTCFVWGWYEKWTKSYLSGRPGRLYDSRSLSIWCFVLSITAVQRNSAWWQGTRFKTYLVTSLPKSFDARSLLRQTSTLLTSKLLVCRHPEPSLGARGLIWRQRTSSTVAGTSTDCLVFEGQDDETPVFDWTFWADAPNKALNAWESIIPLAEASAVLKLATLFWAKQSAFRKPFA